MCQHVSLDRRLLPPKRLTRLLFFLFTECTNIIFPRTGGKEKACDYFLFITVHSSQPAIASFSPLAEKAI